MNIRKIKERANQLLSVDKQQYIRILMILVLLELIPTLFSTGHDILSRIIYIIISLAFIAVSHGYVVSSLKMVRNQSSLLSDDDALVGFKRFKGLFSTYLLNNIVLFFITFAAMFILMMIFGAFLSGIQLDSFANEISLSGNYTQVLLSIFSQSPSLLATFILFYMLMIVIVFVISSYLFAVPYLLERYQMTNLMAIKESYRFMKGHIFDYIKLSSSLSGFDSSFRKAIFDVDNKKYTAIQANIVSGLLDEEKSSIRWFTSGRIMEVYDYVFNSSSDFPPLFKLKEYPIYTFCTEDVADKLRDCNFRQLELVECKTN